MDRRSRAVACHNRNRHDRFVRSYSTKPAMVSAASSWSVGPTWLYMPSVIKMVEWPNRSLHNSRVDAALEREGGPGVAQAVEGQLRQRVLWVFPVEVVLVAAELQAESFGMVWPAIGSAEDEILVLESFADEEAFFVLSNLMCT